MNIHIDYILNLHIIYILSKPTLLNSYYKLYYYEDICRYSANQNTHMTYNEKKKH